MAFLNHHHRDSIQRNLIRTAAALMVVGVLAAASEAAVIAHWSFDEIVNANQFADSTGTYHATIAAIGGPPGVTVDVADKVFGAGSANFDRGPSPNQGSGTATDGAPGAYATAPHLAGIYTGSHTIAAWVKVNNDTTHSGLLGDWSNDAPGGRAYLYGFTGGTDNSAGAEKPSITVQNVAGNNGPINFSSNAALPFSKDEWHHVAWVVDRVAAGTSNLSIFVDGGLFHSAVWTPASGDASIRETANPTWIGLKEDNGLDFDGKVDELFVIDHALGEAGVRYLMGNNAIPEPASAMLLVMGLTIASLVRPRRLR